MKTEIQNILDNDVANLACLLDVFIEHPELDGKFVAAATAIKSQFMAIWEKLEAEVCHE